MWTWFRNTSAVDLQSDVSFFLAGAGVPTFRQSLPRISAELDRARRYQRVLAIALFSVDRLLAPGVSTFSAAAGNGADRSWLRHTDAALAGSDGLLPVLLACLLRENMRETDIVTYASAQLRCLVAMPEVNAAQARQAVSRVHDLAASRFTSPVRAGISVFPQHGLTLEELIRCAEEGAQRAVEGPHLVETGTGGASLTFR